MGLKFEVADLRNELDAFRRLAAELLGPGATEVLRQAESELLGVAKSSSGPRRWQIYADNPLLTLASVGEYMPDDEGGEIVYAEISFVWEIEPVRPSGNTQPAKHVELNGLASTLVRLLEGDPRDHRTNRELAMWKMDVADDNAPGAYFHVQVLGRHHDTLFPKSVDIPRFPGVLNSPFACMEFVLGELFQAKWARIAQRDSSQLRQWSSIQSHRHAKHLDWAIDCVAKASGSPWLAWKQARPLTDLYMRV